MTPALCSEESTERWKFLLGIKNLRPTIPGKAASRKRTLSAFLNPHSSKEATSSSTTDPSEDPFDCSSVAVLPNHDIVEKTIDHYLEEWKKLDNRRIHRTPSAFQRLPKAQETEKRETEKNQLAISDTKKLNTNHGGGWRAKEERLWLPDGFDYNTKYNDQQSIEEESLVDDDNNDLVISLENPNKKLSYLRELSKLFHSIPSCRELEEQTRCGHKVENTLRVYQEIKNLTTKSSAALARLRLPNRHGLPQSISNNNILSPKQPQASCSYSATVFLEFWKRQPNTSSDCHRMVLEFLHTQTLWEVHKTLTDMIEDDLWDATYGDGATANNNIVSTNDASNTLERERLEREREEDCHQQNSGCFLIENTFYETGSVDYTKPILEWIDGNKLNHPNPIRRRYLGIDPFVIERKTMKETKLSQIRFRMNTRYYHACHGNVETTFMLVDRMLIESNKCEGTSYPIIHDEWTASNLYAVPTCEACHVYQSIFKTSADCKTTDGPRSLCEECCRDLNLLENEQHSVKLYRQWHNQANISNRMAEEETAAI